MRSNEFHESIYVIKEAVLAIASFFCPKTVLSLTLNGYFNDQRGYIRQQLLMLDWLYLIWMRRLSGMSRCWDSGYW